MERVVNTLGACSVGGIGSPMAGVRTFPAEEELFARARELGQELCRCIGEKTTFPEQAEFHAKFGAYMSGLVDIMQEYWVFEREFWANRRQMK